MNGTQISDAKFVRCSLELFLGGGGYEKSQENQVGGICFRSPTYHVRKMSSTTKNSLRKKNGTIKPEIFYKMFDCCHLNQARTQTLSVLPGPRARSGPVQTFSP
jgi:hypothetical protein